MQCVNHPGVPAQSYCHSCGKALCANCVRSGGGFLLCEQCEHGWRGIKQAFSGSQGPNPAVASILGLIPGVGAMYNGQLFKGLIHVVIFAVLISITDHYPIFGLFIAAWVLYQSFEAHHTAKARRDGLPLPDPFGINELGNWLNLGGQAGGQAGATGPVPPVAPPVSGPIPGAASGSGYGSGSAADASSASGTGEAGPAVGAHQAPPHSGYTPPGQGYGAGYSQPPYQATYGAPHSGAGSGYGPGYGPGHAPGYDPVIAPVPPVCWRRKEPVGAVILIALGLIFLFHSLGYVTERVIHYSWPVLLIGLGIWLVIRQLGYSKGGPK